MLIAPLLFTRVSTLMKIRRMRLWLIRGGRMGGLARADSLGKKILGSKFVPFQMECVKCGGAPTKLIQVQNCKHPLETSDFGIFLASITGHMSLRK